MKEDFIEEYNQLSDRDKERVKEVAGKLLGKTYIVNQIYDRDEKKIIYNGEYRFVVNHISIFTQIFELIGYKIDIDDNYGVVYITNELGVNSVKFTKITTILLFVLRLMYDEEKEKLQLSKEVVVTISDINNKLMDIGVFNKRITKQDTRNIVNEISKYNIIQKLDSDTENPDARILIFPSILYAVSNEKLSLIIKLIKENDLDTSEET